MKIFPCLFRSEFYMLRFLVCRTLGYNCINWMNKAIVVSYNTPIVSWPVNDSFPPLNPKAQ